MGSWGSHGKPVLGKTGGVGYVPQASSKPWASSTHLSIVSNFLFYWPGPFSEICAGDIPLRNHWSPWKATKGILSGHRMGNWGGQFELVEPGHFGWGFSRAAHPALWSFGGPKSLHFLHLWKNYALSLKQSSPSGLPSSRAGIVWLRAAKPFSLQGASHSLCPQGPGELLCSPKHLLGVLFWLPQ